MWIQCEINVFRFIQLILIRYNYKNDEQSFITYFVVDSLSFI